MRTLFLLFFIVALTLFWLQNPQVVALFFFGSLVPLQLSLGSWVVVFVLLGVLTGILVQVLGRGSAFLHNRKKKQRVQSPEKQNTQDSDTRLYRDSEWGQQTEDDDDWEIETPPPPSRPPTPQAVKTKDKSSFSPPVVEQEKTQLPPEETPIYPKLTKPPVRDNNIYDANFRVLNSPKQAPPSSNKEPQDTEEDDWI